MSSTLFCQARIPSGEGNAVRVVNFRLKNGKFQAIAPDLEPSPGEKQVNLHPYLILPGAIDTHVHFNTPGFTERETFSAGSAFALSGGVTTIVDMPCTSLPPVTTLANLEKKLSAIYDQSYTDFALWGGVSGNLIESGAWRKALLELQQAGVCGFKTYALSGMPTFTHLSPDQLAAVLEFAAHEQILIAHHAEDPAIIHPLMEQLQQQGRCDPEAYFWSRPTEAEVSSIRRLGNLAARYQARVHVVHVSSGAGAQLISKLKSDGVDITGETCPHYLAFNYQDLIRMGSILKTAPVVKTAADNVYLWEALARGELDWLASDHAPCPPEQKQTGSIWTDYGGISGTGLLLLFLYSQGYRQQKISLAQLCDLIAGNPARRLGLFPRKGQITVGADADFVCLDEQANTTIRGAEFASLGKFTPFEGQQWPGQIAAVYQRGNLVYQAGQGILGKPQGIFIEPNH